MDKPSFDHQLARSCAHAFSVSTELGCVVSGIDGCILFEEGQGFTRCPLSRHIGCSQEDCTASHIYGMQEAERFGGKYIYFCPLGLTCFVSPIIGDEGTAAKITAGPFIMVEQQDFIDCELKENLHLSGDVLENSIQALKQIPFISPTKATELSNLLFMSVGFMNNVHAENELLEAGRLQASQSHISAYISQLKNEKVSSVYPFLMEQALLQSIAHGECERLHQQMEELLGAIFITTNNLQAIKARGYELLVMISRLVIENGADTEYVLGICDHYITNSAKISDFPSFCSWIMQIVSDLLDNTFNRNKTKHANIVHRCIQFIGSNYAEHIDLNTLADMVYLSPAYLSRIFKAETGTTINQYLNRVRITKAKELLHNRQLKLVDISLSVGYEDQSYFTRVFRKIAGISPSEYRNKTV